MILIFDLDDTLYDERGYVESGLAAVAGMGEAEFGWDRHESLATMIAILDRDGRGAIFDRWLAGHGRSGRRLVEKCVHAYRYHRPDIALEPSTRSLLEGLSRHPLYLVTDGHKVVQQRKVEALAIAPLFRRMFITHQYGLRHAKPSTYCFERIREIEGCEWGEMAYVGDNPAKDFVNLNKLGVHTIRVLTGVHRHAVALPGYDAGVTIENLAELNTVIARITR